MPRERFYYIAWAIGLIIVLWLLIRVVLPLLGV
jgi:hypothetical protein